jgi:hypothetical protein
MPASLSPMTQGWPMRYQSGESPDLREGTGPAGEITSAKNSGERRRRHRTRGGQVGEDDGRCEERGEGESGREG